MAALEQRQEEAPVVVDTDRLRSLPEGILVDILSFLPTQAAVSTSVLSTRWRSLWPHVNSLHLHQSHGQNTDDIYTVADQLLLTRLTSPILQTFSVHAGDSRPLHFERWLSHLCDRRVEDIDIACGRSSTQPPPFTLPLRIFRTRSLVRLLLHPFVRYELPHNDDVVFELPHLKKLLLAFLPSRWSFVSKLIRSCPSLEDLSLAAPWPMSDNNIHYAYGLIMDISCATLKGLELDLCFYDNVEVVIDAPELVWLGLSGGETATYSFVNQRPSLICATIILPSIPLSVYDMIKNVTLLEILETSFEMLESLEVATGDFSFFPNLTKLHLRFDWVNSSLYDYPFECTSPRLLIHVKEIKVKTSQVYRANKLVEYLLNNAPVMESLIFDVTGDIPLQSEHRIMLEEMMACMRLYSYLSSVNALRCVITFNGRCSKIPLNISEFEELESRVEELR